MCLYIYKTYTFLFDVRAFSFHISIGSKEQKRVVRSIIICIEEGRAKRMFLEVDDDAECRYHA